LCAIENSDPAVSLSCATTRPRRFSFSVQRGSMCATSTHVEIPVCRDFSTIARSGRPASRCFCSASSSSSCAGRGASVTCSPRLSMILTRPA
jgi:hypothetical protein